MNAVARVVIGVIIYFIGADGFRRTYRVVLIAEIFMAFTMP
jgi:hypothetical protein